jgi:hypothetical protein
MEIVQHNIGGPKDRGLLSRSYLQIARHGAQFVSNAA